MRDVRGNLWTYGPLHTLRVIGTNGECNSRGEAVMGRGCAEEARDRFPGLARAAGAALRTQGNHVWLAPASLTHGILLATFPVKHRWRDRADLALIARSAAELRALVDAHGYTEVVVARPGCGKGRLSYDDVRPVLLDAGWDDRFAVISWE